MKTFLVKICFICLIMRSLFQISSFVVSLALKQRLWVTRKLLIEQVPWWLKANVQSMFHFFLKVARRGFSGSIPPKFEHKLRCHWKRLGKITTTAVWQGHRNCHSNEMHDAKITWNRISRHLELFFQNHSRELFSSNCRLNVREL